MVASKRLAALAAAFAAAACTAPQRATNLEQPVLGGAYQAQYRDIEVARAATDGGQPALRAPAMNAATCLPYAGDLGGSPGAKGGTGHIPGDLLGERLSRGDLVSLALPGDETFTGDYVISRDGLLRLPYLAPIPARGRSVEAVADDIRAGLVRQGFYDGRPVVSLLLKDLATVKVAVAGAVFEPQPVDIGGVPGDQVDSLRQGALGASTEARNLTVAIRYAGGIRPDADLSAVELRRGGAVYLLDLRPLVEGRLIEDVMLIAGDEVFVPSRNCFQDALMRPGPISPPGISLFLSNLTQPAADNASSAVSEEVRGIPYGTRFMQAVVDANCVGGARATSADRSAALFTRNPVSGVSHVVERKVEVMRVRADRDDYDPYLLPGDALACYDSGVTNIGEAARILGLLGAITLLPWD